MKIGQAGEFDYSGSQALKAFAAGASMVTIGSIAVTNPDLLMEWIDKYGADKLIYLEYPIFKEILERATGIYIVVMSVRTVW